MKLGEVLRKWRVMADLGIREVAADMGISAATLSRIERGESMDGRTLGRIWSWLVREIK